VRTDSFSRRWGAQNLIIFWPQKGGEMGREGFCAPVGSQSVRLSPERAGDG